ncbi:MAG: hypothetical protein ACUVXB_18080 [Bryobacteraceae bacterium]
MSLRAKDFVSVGTMGIMILLISLVEKNDFSLNKQIILPILPTVRVPAIETFRGRYVFFLIGSLGRGIH